VISDWVGAIVFLGVLHCDLSVARHTFITGFTYADISLSPRRSITRPFHR